MIHPYATLKEITAALNAGTGTRDEAETVLCARIAKAAKKGQVGKAARTQRFLDQLTSGAALDYAAAFKTAPAADTPAVEVEAPVSPKAPAAEKAHALSELAAMVAATKPSDAQLAKFVSLVFAQRS